MSSCNILECNRIHKAKGFCSMHYQRLKAHGDPLKRIKLISEPHGMVKTPEWYSWVGMKERCNSPNHFRYYNYGGRGITICDRWQQSFQNFYEDMGARPDGKTLDRIDNNGNYEPFNCKWSTYKEQANNRRNTREKNL